MGIIKLNSEILSNAMAHIKVGLTFLWVAYLIIAGLNNQLIEAFLLSIAVGIVSYFLFGYNSNPSQSVDKSNQCPSTSHKLSSEDYLKVFFL